MTEQPYTPGVCNINSQEAAKRRRSGYFDLALFFIFATSLVATDANWPMRLLLFIPAFIASLAFLQADQKFCVAYSGAGKQNAGEGSTKPQPVVEEAARKLDALKARKIYIQAFVISAVVTAIVLFI